MLRIRCGAYDVGAEGEKTGFSRSPASIDKSARKMSVLSVDPEPI